MFQLLLLTDVLESHGSGWAGSCGGDLTHNKENGYVLSLRHHTHTHTHTHGSDFMEDDAWPFHIQLKAEHYTQNSS